MDLIGRVRLLLLSLTTILSIELIDRIDGKPDCKQKDLADVTVIVSYAKSHHDMIPFVNEIVRRAVDSWPVSKEKLLVAFGSDSCHPNQSYFRGDHFDQHSWREETKRFLTTKNCHVVNADYLSPSKSLLHNMMVWQRTVFPKLLLYVLIFPSFSQEEELEWSKRTSRRPTDVHVFVAVRLGAERQQRTAILRTIGHRSLGWSGEITGKQIADQLLKSIIVLLCDCSYQMTVSRNCLSIGNACMAGAIVNVTKRPYKSVCPLRQGLVYCPRKNGCTDQSSSAGGLQTAAGRRTALVIGAITVLASITIAIAIGRCRRRRRRPPHSKNTKSASSKVGKGRLWTIVAPPSLTQSSLTRVMREDQRRNAAANVQQTYGVNEVSAVQEVSTYRESDPSVSPLSPNKRAKPSHVKHIPKAGAASAVAKVKGQTLVKGAVSPTTTMTTAATSKTKVKARSTGWGASKPRSHSKGSKNKPSAARKK